MELHMRRAGLMAFLFLIACGDDDAIVQRVRPPGVQPAAATVQSESAGEVHEVQMLGSVEAGFRFDPENLTIRVGDTVRWVNGSGFPHNVAFYADSIPEGAMVVIETVMPTEGKLGPMNGRIVSEPNDAFEMVFLNFPSGTYRYFSVPQEAMGMIGTITVELQ
jgi:plastocyanin